MILGKAYKEVAAREKELDANWFAWRPVRLEDGRWVWLRRLTREHWHGWGCSGISYYLKEENK